MSALDDLADLFSDMMHNGLVEPRREYLKRLLREAIREEIRDELGIDEASGP